MHFHPTGLIRAVVEASGLGYQGSLALLDLYGFIDFSVRNGHQPSIRALAKSRGTKEDMIRSKALLLEKLGWLSFSSEYGLGTVWTLHGIPEGFLPASEEVGAHV